MCSDREDTVDILMIVNPEMVPRRLSNLNMRLAQFGALVADVDKDACFEHLYHMLDSFVAQSLLHKLLVLSFRLWRELSCVTKAIHPRLLHHKRRIFLRYAYP